MESAALNFSQLELDTNFPNAIQTYYDFYDIHIYWGSDRYSMACRLNLQIFGKFDYDQNTMQLHNNAFFSNPDLNNTNCVIEGSLFASKNFKNFYIELQSRCPSSEENEKDLDANLENTQSNTQNSNNSGIDKNIKDNNNKRNLSTTSLSAPSSPSNYTIPHILIELDINLTYKYNNAFMYYGFISCTLAILYFIVTMREYKLILLQDNSHFKLSVWSLCLQGFNTFLLGVSMNTGIESANFMLISLFWVMLFVMVEWKMIQYISAKQLVFKKAGFYMAAACIATMVLVHLYPQILGYTYLASNCYWAPQILFNYVNRYRKGYSPSFVIALSILKSVIPLYIFYCPVNIYFREPQRFLGGIFVSMQLMQVGLLCMQYYLGSRLDGLQLFKSKITYSVLSSYEEVCSICLDTVDNDFTGIETSCSHFYHLECLKTWMKERPTCPDCRTQLLPLEDLD